MSKYYKAEDVIRAIAEQLCWIARTEYGDKFTTEDWLEEAEDYVSDLPTIDIVRCRECKKAFLTYDGSCKYCEEWKDDDDNYIEVYHDGDHFCPYGERKDNE